MTRTTPDAWRKSSYSNTDGGACVEVAGGCPGGVPVRDSKDIGRGHFAVPASAWSALTKAIKQT